jgi:CDP-paratose 2-epimerase
MMEAIALCEEITGRRLAWSLGDANRIGDHVWYVSDLTRFEQHYPGWKITHDVRAIMEAIHRSLVERTAPPVPARPAAPYRSDLQPSPV